MTSTTSEIEATTTYQASHCWPNAHNNRAYLRHPHVHDFRITTWARVSHGDRDIEFHDLRARLGQAVERMGKIGPVEEFGVVPHLGSRSCEHIAEHLLGVLPEVHRIRVMEDEYVGATVERTTALGSTVPRDRSEPQVDISRQQVKTALGMEMIVQTHDFRHYRKRPRIVTLCGSTRFKDEFRLAEARMEGDGICVFTVGFFAHADNVPISERAKEAADELHKWKIAMSDAIFVVNPGGYIGSSTRSEIDFAKALGVRIEYLVDPE